MTSDPFTNGDLDLAGQWGHTASRLVTYLTGCGDGATYGHVYTDVSSPEPHRTVWITAPPDPLASHGEGIGQAQETFVEHVAEQVRHVDPCAVALYQLWPRGRYTYAPEEPATLTRVVFRDATQTTRRATQTFIVESNQQEAISPVSHTAHTVSCRFGGPGWVFTRLADLESTLGTSVPLLHMSPDEINADVRRRLPNVWLRVRAHCLQSQRDASAALDAQLREWDSGDDAAPGDFGSAV